MVQRTARPFCSENGPCALVWLRLAAGPFFCCLHKPSCISKSWSLKFCSVQAMGSPRPAGFVGLAKTTRLSILVSVLHKALCLEWMGAFEALFLLLPRWSNPCYRGSGRWRGWKNTRQRQPTWSGEGDRGRWKRWRVGTWAHQIAIRIA